MTAPIVIYGAFSESGKCYVGQARDFDERRRHHCALAEKGGGFAFHSALRKHGLDAFRWRILARVPEWYANEAEKQYIRLYRALAPHGYNLRAGGNVAPLTAAHKAKIGAGNTGKTRTAATRAKISAGKAGVRKTPAARARIGAASTGRRHSTATRRKMRLAKLGKNNPNYQHGRGVGRGRAVL